MGRPHGTHNEDYEEKRKLLLERMSGRMVAPTERASFRELAAAAGVSMPTLRHYFKDRNGVVAAWLAWKGSLGKPHLDVVARTDDDFATSIRSLMVYVRAGMDYGRVNELHVVGLTEGLTNPPLGPAYLQSILEPTLAATETRLAGHQTRGEMRKDVSVRTAALALLSPIILAVLHQRDLGGSTLRCLDMEDFYEAHAAAFVRAYGTQPPAP